MSKYPSRILVTASRDSQGELLEPNDYVFESPDLQNEKDEEYMVKVSWLKKPWFFQLLAFESQFKVGIER